MTSSKNSLFDIDFEKEEKHDWGELDAITLQLDVFIQIVKVLSNIDDNHYPDFLINHVNMLIETVDKPWLISTFAVKGLQRELKKLNTMVSDKLTRYL